MAYSRVALAVIVVCMVAACGASGSPSAAAVPTPSGAATASPIPTATASPIPAATDRAIPPASPSLAAPDAPPSPTPSPNPTTGAVVPPKPSGVTFAEKRKGDEDPATTEITQTVSWKGPRSDGVQIRVYGVSECLAKPANPAPDTKGPCLVEHTPLPASVRTLLATAPASDGAVSWTWTGTFTCEIGLANDPDGPAYFALVLAAYGASGHSIFAIAEPGEWWQPATDDIVC